MKRMYTFIKYMVVFLSVVAGSVSARAQNAFYVYRNDGAFNALFFEEVDSMQCSKVDVGGLVHANYVTQEIYTPDSVYRIPLAAIDSIGFVTPETIVNEHFFPLTAEHVPYIVKADTLAFTFSLSTPSGLLPKVGNVVSASYDCESFPDGIVAKVVAVSKTGGGYEYECEPASYDDVYDQIVYYGYGQFDSEDNPVQKRVVRMEGSFAAEAWNQSFAGTLEASGTTTHIAVNDRALFDVTIRKTKDSPFYVQLVFCNEFGSDLSFNASSEVSVSPSRLKLGPTVKCGKISLPNAPFLWFQPQLSLYGYSKVEGSVDLNFNGHYNRKDKYTMIYSGGNWNFYYAPVTDAGVDVAELSMKGYAEVGLLPEIFISLNGFPTGIGIKPSLGLRESVDFKFDALKYSDTGVYDAVKDSKAVLSSPQSVSIFAQAGLFEGNSVRGEFPLWEKDIVLKEQYLLPVFSNVESRWQDDDKTSAVVNADVNRDLLLPVQLGFSLCDENGDELQSYVNPVAYQSSSTWPFRRLENVFEKLEQGKDYVCYPTVKFGKFEFRATPSVELEADSCMCPDHHHPHMIDLGLPSGTKWACCNVGASSPEEYGGYYAWGETEEKSYYDWSSYKYCKGSFDTLTKYCTSSRYGTVDNKTVLEPEDDVAHVKWGGSWRMPTEDEIRELTDNCSWTWTSQNGVNGYVVTSNSSGNRIFLPAAGYRWFESVYGRGSYGDYWSASLCEDDSYYACELYFISYCWDWDCVYRGYGWSVRPVTE